MRARIWGGRIWYLPSRRRISENVLSAFLPMWARYILMVSRVLYQVINRTIRSAPISEQREARTTWYSKHGYM